MKTAILIDGGFFLKRYQKLYPDASTDTPENLAKNIFEYALRLLEKANRTPKDDHGSCKFQRELYRIFFYDCPPLDKKIRNPVTKKRLI